MQLLGGQDVDALRSLLGNYELRLDIGPASAPIPGSYWGEPEAGLIGSTVHARPDTPLHSVLHEACHAICMGPARRAKLERDAGGDDAEENAVCYLQLLLADALPGIGRRRLAADMDAWGYSFRLGSALAWFEGDAQDAQEWLTARGLLPAESTAFSAT